MASDTAATGDLMGVGEAAEALGVTKQRVHQLSRTPGFPQPIARLRAGPVWAAKDIRFYVAVRRNVHPCPSCRCQREASNDA
jgi:hypothetical protein